MSFDSLKPYAKSIVGALTAGLTAYGTALTDGEVTQQEWVTIALAVLAAGGIVFGVPNKDPEATHQAESVQPPELEQPGTLQGLVNDALNQPYEPKHAEREQ